MSKKFTLPTYAGDYVLLTPRDILTKDETWINRNEMIEDFRDICESIPNDQLRGQLSDYFNRCLPDSPKKKERESAADLTIKNYPSFIDYYIRYKEQNSGGLNVIVMQRLAKLSKGILKLSNFWLIQSLINIRSSLVQRMILSKRPISESVILNR